MKRLLILLFCTFSYLSAQTGNIVPAATGTRSLGVASNHWLVAYIDSLYLGNLLNPAYIGQTASLNFVSTAQISSWNSKLSSYTESDPIFSAWNKSSGISITKSQVSDFPTLATVATSGSYSDLSNKPTIPAAQVQTDWNASSGLGVLLNKPSLATVATSGSYNDLSNKPTIPSAQVNSDWNSSSGLSQILNKPSIPTNTNQLTNGSNFITLTSLSGTSPINYNNTTGAISFTNPGYITGNQSISLGGILSGSGTTSITVSAASGYYMPSTGDQTNWNAKISSYTETDPIVKAINGIVKSNGTTISVAVAGTDYLTPSGSAASLTSFPTFNQNTTGTASNLSGTPALPNGTSATTQAKADNSTKLATTAYTQLYTQPLYATPTALTAGSTVTWTPVLGTNIYTLTPAQAETINMGTVPSGCVGSQVVLIITTSGTTAYTLTFGTNMKSQGTLSTGTTSGKTFILEYLIYSTTAVYEMSRTSAE
jgi:hypothetical protein